MHRVSDVHVNKTLSTFAWVIYLVFAFFSNVPQIIDPALCNCV